MERLTNIFESILLLEGRKEKARERYPDIEEDIFNFFVNNDPSGNQKYLDWGLGSFDYLSHAYDEQLSLAENIMESIRFFHEHQQRFPINHRDINRFKDLDDLNKIIDDVNSEIERSKEKKEAKKDADVVYKDDRWLVVSPKSYKASCVYGAGTKWCIASRDRDSHWKSYSKNSSFFFIIDKTKKQDDPLYKVAYRRVGSRNKYEVWNATDSEISKNTVGQEYFNGLPEELKIKTEEYHRIKYPEVDNTDLKSLTPQGQALADFLGHTGFYDHDYSHYGLDTFQTDDGEEYAVGNDEDVDYAVREYYESYVEDQSADDIDPDGNYMSMNDEVQFIDNEVEEYMDNISIEEIIDLGPYPEELEKLSEKLDDEDLSDEEREDIEEKFEDYMEQSKENIRRYIKSEWEECLSDGPVDCLVHNKGWYSVNQLVDSGLVYFDTDSLVESYVDDAYYGDALAHYDGQENDGEDLDGNHYYIFRTN